MNYLSLFLQMLSISGKYIWFNIILNKSSLRQRISLLYLVCNKIIWNELLEFAVVLYLNFCPYAANIKISFVWENFLMFQKNHHKIFGISIENIIENYQYIMFIYFCSIFPIYSISYIYFILKNNVAGLYLYKTKLPYKFKFSRN